jgi:hypothetical protein
VGCQKSESMIEVEFPASNGDWGFVPNLRLHKWAQSLCASNLNETDRDVHSPIIRDKVQIVALPLYLYA